MSDVKLLFKLKLKSGAEIEQDITVPADGDGKEVPTVEQFIMQMLQQYAAVGMLKKDREKNKFILITCHEIANVECEVPSVLIPTTSDLANAVRSQQTKSGITL